MQELGKFNFKIKLIPNGLEIYMSFSINNKLIFIGSFQFLSFSVDGLVKNLGKNDFRYLSQEFDFEKFKEELQSKEKFCKSLTDKKN